MYKNWWVLCLKIEWKIFFAFCFLAKSLKKWIFLFKTQLFSALKKLCFCKNKCKNMSFCQILKTKIWIFLLILTNRIFFLKFRLIAIFVTLKNDFLLFLNFAFSQNLAHFLRRWAFGAGESHRQCNWQWNWGHNLGPFFPVIFANFAQQIQCKFGLSLGNCFFCFGTFHYWCVEICLMS